VIAFRLEIFTVSYPGCSLSADPNVTDKDHAIHSKIWPVGK